MDPVTAALNAITAACTAFNNVWMSMSDEQRRQIVTDGLENQQHVVEFFQKLFKVKP